MSKGISLNNLSSSGYLTQDHSQAVSTASTLHWLFESLGWHDISQEVAAKQLETSTAQQSLIAAVQFYEENHSEVNGQQVLIITAKEITRIEAERDYALRTVQQLQQQLKQEQRAAEKIAAESQPASSYWEVLQQISGYFSESITTRVKTFFGSTTEQQIEKYLETAQNREKELNALSSYREQIQTTLAASVFTHDEHLEEKPSAFSRHLLQTSTPTEMNVIYCWPGGSCSLTGVSDGQAGFTLQGLVNSHSGSSVSSAGDINGDHLDDILVSSTPDFAVGQITVVFGTNETGVWGSGTLNLADFADGQHGFALQGEFPDGSYLVSSAGDINGDGLADILVGAQTAYNLAGKTTVIFGSNKTGAWGTGTLNLITLADGQRGFTLLGQASEQSASSISSAGDINGDGLDDILIGVAETAKVTVVFGSNKPGAWGSGTLNLTTFADGQRGFTLLGLGQGHTVSSAGDINGDQLDDFLIGNPNYDLSSGTGQATVVFGSNQSGAWGSGTLNLTTFADGQRGFVLMGQAAGGRSGSSVSSAGDINGDGLGDILVSAPYTSNGGQTTVVFGSHKPGAWGSGMLNLTTLADGQRGFVLQGNSGDAIGSSVSSAGDINGDGLDDILIEYLDTAKVTVVFGSNISSAWGTGILNLDALADGQRGFMLLGQATNGVGNSVSSAGDFNGDQLDDFLVGAPSTFTGAGATTLVFGDKSPAQVTVNHLSIAVGEVIVFNPTLLSATSSTQNNATIVLTPEDVQNGRFEAIGAPGVTLSSFLSGNITSVQFQQDNSALAPSYQITVRHTALLYAYSIAQVDFLGYPPVLLNNEVYVNQGLPTLVTSSDLSASDADTPVASLRFLFSNIQHAQFNLLNSNGSILSANISSCLQQVVFNQQLQLMPDGSTIAPSYTVAVTDGFSTTPSRIAIVTFNQAPIITVNAMTLDQGQVTFIRPQDISATDDQTSSNDLLFQLTNITAGDYFEYSNDIGYALTSFNQFPLVIGNVAFFQNGSNIPPIFSIRVTDGQIWTAWHTPVIHFNHRPLLDRTLPARTVVEGSPFSIALGDDLFTDPDGDPLTLSAQQLGGAPLLNKMTFNASRAELSGILETLISLQIQIIASDPRGLTASTNFTLQSVAPAPGFNFQILTSALSVLGSAAITVLGYMWWRKNAADHRTGYEFANMLRKVLNLEYYDFTKDKGELYKSHIQSFLADLKYQHNNFYATLITPDERRSFAVCVAEIIQNKELLKKTGCCLATYNRFFLFNASRPNGLKLEKFADQSSQIAQEAVTAWREESQRTAGNPLTRWPYPTSGIRESKALTRKETSGGNVELKELTIDKSLSSFAENRHTTFASSPLSIPTPQNFHQEHHEGAAPM